MESTFVTTLVLVALGLLLTVTLGVGYLTFAEWRDRRREERERRGR